MRIGVWFDIASVRIGGLTLGQLQAGGAVTRYISGFVENYDVVFG
jgi:hypothetical protein